MSSTPSLRMKANKSANDTSTTSIVICRSLLCLQAKGSNFIRKYSTIQTWDAIEREPSSAYEIQHIRRTSHLHQRQTISSQSRAGQKSPLAMGESNLVPEQGGTGQRASGKCFATQC